MDKIIKPVVFKSYRPKTDGSVSITFETLEQTPNEVAIMHQLRNQYGIILFKSEDQLTPEEIKDLDTLDLEYNGKSKSRRLKDVIYRVWESGEGEKDHKQFYSDKMEQIINHLKNQIE